MAWLFRRAAARSRDAEPAESTAPAEGTVPTDGDPAAAASADAPSPRAAWRDLPGGGLPVLGSMPSLTDAGFSRSLPSRWHTAPALGPLGHDVRTDVPGGLVSGVARTVDPRDTTPADLVWRSGVPTAPTARTAPALNPGAGVPQNETESGVPFSGTTPDQSDDPIPLPPDSTSNAPAVVVPENGTTPDASDVTGPPAPPAPARRAPLVSALSRMIGRRPATAPPTSAPLTAASPTTVTSDSLVTPATLSTPETTALSTVDEQFTSQNAPIATIPQAAQSTQTAQPTQIAQIPETPQLSVSPTSTPSSAGTAQTRRVLLNAASAVEARDPRPVPADVTDGPVAATPESGVDTEPETETLASPPSQPVSALSPLPTPREARPGPDLSGSAPAAAPLVSRTPPLPRSTPRTPFGVGPAIPAAEAVPTPTATIAPDATAEAESIDVTAPITPSPTSAPTSAPTSMSASDDAPESPLPTPAPTSAVAPAAAPAPIAPLVSAAQRLIPAAAPISRLQAPSASVDQPVGAIEPIARTFAAAPSGPPAAPLAMAGAAALNSISGAATPSPMSAAPPAALTTPTPPAGSSSPPSAPLETPRAAMPTPFQPVARELSAAASSFAPPQPPSASPSSFSSAPQSPNPSPSQLADDPAALDSLARQLYGRFSRRLAGELLVDRERAQFLTDLS